MSLNVFQRLGALGCLVGLIGFLTGSKFLLSQPFPFCYLILCIPIPFVYYSKFSIALRGIVTRMSASILQLSNVPAFNDGNVPEALSVRLQFAAVDKRPADVTVVRQRQRVNHTEENKVRTLNLKTTTCTAIQNVCSSCLHIVQKQFRQNVYTRQ